MAGIVLLFLQACRGNDQQADTSSDINAATGFLQSALQGDYKAAKTFMVNDSINLETLGQIERSNMKNLSKDEKDGYRGASIRIHNIHPLNDTVSLIAYSNSYINKVDSLKVVKQAGKWLVDFKYILNHRTDSL